MKECFKCHQVKPLDAFYKHSQIGDGHLNKCCECTKRDAAARLERKKKDPDWVAAERARCREKSARSMRRQPSRESRMRWDKANKHKKRAQGIANNAVRCGVLVAPPTCEMCNRPGPLYKHHPDYSEPLFVQWLCSKCHGIAHRKPLPII